MIILIFVIANFYLLKTQTDQRGKPWQIEIHRITQQIKQDGIDSVSLDNCTYVKNIRQFSGDDAFFKNTADNSCIQKIGDKIYRFDYQFSSDFFLANILFRINLILAVLSFLILGLLLFIRQKILKPFAILCNVPYELSRGNLTMPLLENKSRFFGR